MVGAQDTSPEIMFSRYLGFIITVPISIALCLLPWEDRILPLETLFDRFGEIPAHVYIASLWFFYLLGLPSFIAATLNRVSALHGAFLVCLLAVVGIALFYYLTDGPDWQFSVLVCIFAPLPLCAAYLLGFVARRLFLSVRERKHQVA